MNIFDLVCWLILFIFLFYNLHFKDRFGKVIASVLYLKESFLFLTNFEESYKIEKVYLFY